MFPHLTFLIIKLRVKPLQHWHSARVPYGCSLYGQTQNEFVVKSEKKRFLYTKKIIPRTFQKTHRTKSVVRFRKQSLRPYVAVLTEFSIL